MYRIKPDELYHNYLQKYQTPWLVIGDIRDQFDEKTQFQVVQEEDETYYFIIVLPNSDEAHVYNVYKEEDFETYDRSQSALYVQRAAECLSLYREPIGQYDLDFIWSVLRNIGKPVRMRDMTVDLFYRNLLSENLHIVKYGEKFEKKKNNTLLQIKPVYGPSHNPLLIKSSGGEILTILFTNNLIKKEGEAGDVYRISIERDSVISYYIIDLVKILSERNATTKEDVVITLSNYTGFKFPLPRYDARLSVLDRVKLLSIKLTQLYEPKTPLQVEDEWRERIVLIALETIRSIVARLGLKEPEEIKVNLERILENMITDFYSVK